MANTKISPMFLFENMIYGNILRGRLHFFRNFEVFFLFFKERNERQLPCNTDSQFYLKCLQLSETSSHIYTDKGQFSEKTKQNKFHSIRKLACSSGNMVSMLSNFF